MYLLEMKRRLPEFIILKTMCNERLKTYVSDPACANIQNHISADVGGWHFILAGGWRLGAVVRHMAMSVEKRFSTAVQPHPFPGASNVFQ